MDLTRSVVAGALLAHGAVVGVPSVGAAPRPVTLTGTTVVTGSRSAWVAVRLPRPVDFDANRDIALDARGRLAGVVLKKAGPWNSGLAARLLIGWCGTPGCAPTFPNENRSEVFVPGGNGVSGRLPAGDYRLYVVTDGAPVRATITLRGVGGKPGRVTATHPARVAVLDPKPTLAEPADGPLLYAAGSHRDVPRGGYNVTVVWKDHPAKPPPSATGICRYAGRPQAGTAPAYHWPCQGGGPDLTGGLPADSYATPAGPGRFISLFHTSFLLPPGEWAFGGFSDTPGPVTSAHVHQLWLDF